MSVAPEPGQQEANRNREQRRRDRQDLDVRKASTPIELGREPALAHLVVRTVAEPWPLGIGQRQPYSDRLDHETRDHSPLGQGPGQNVASTVNPGHHFHSSIAILCSTLPGQSVLFCEKKPRKKSHY
jgi:hypothetical protein